MSSTTFRTVLVSGTGKTLGIVVPAEEMAKLGPARRYPVVVTIGDYSYRNSVSWYQGAFMTGLSAENRAGAGVEGGQEVEVTLVVDESPRILELPDELADALRSAGAYDRFRALSYSKQRGLAEPWMKAKSQDAKDRNLAKIVAASAG